MTIKPNLPLRRATLAVVLLNILFNSVYTQLSGTRSIPDITNSIPSLFTPPGYVFAIWGVIYLAFLGYCIIQLLPFNRHELAFDKISTPLIAANVGCSLWIVVFTREWIGVSFLVILLTLFISAILFIYAEQEVKKHEEHKLLRIPFSLFFGWLSVATLANSSLWLPVSGLISPEHTVKLTLILIGLATALGITIGLYYLNSIYPAVIIWAAIGIAISKRVTYPDISTAAIYAAGICTAVILINTIRVFRR